MAGKIVALLIAHLRDVGFLPRLQIIRQGSWPKYENQYNLCVIHAKKRGIV
jgi:hypothetical protein